jgi:hypothetical protein
MSDGISGLLFIRANGCVMTGFAACRAGVSEATECARAGAGGGEIAADECVGIGWTIGDEGERGWAWVAECARLPGS